MDDSISGKQTEEEAFEFYLICKVILREGSFNLRKWLSNSKSLREKIAIYELEHFGKSSEINLEEKHKILGVNWAIDSDELIFSINDLLYAFKDVKHISKRVILKFIASIYDPIGVLSPAVVNVKLLFQKLCHLKLDWDYPLSEELVLEWRKLLSDLSKLKPICLPRFYLDGYGLDEIKFVEMHGFCDASAKAYACSVYLKFVLQDGSIIIKFLCSKSRISPLEKKSLSIPRLELLGCVLLSSLISSCLHSLMSIFSSIDIYCWSDSADCIFWINNTSKTWKQFIQNRVTKIRDNLPGIKWMHCPGSLNPADIPSRGLDITKNNLLKVWLNGPDFLNHSKSSWPNQDVVSSHSANLITEEIELERKTPNVNSVFCIEKFSNYDKVVRILCYVKRFIFNCLSKIRKEIPLSGCIEFKEFKEAEFTLLLSDQLIFKERKCDVIDLYNSLNVYEDKDGLLKVKGRLERSNLSCPILLNKESHLTKLIIWRCHLKRYHSGLKDTLNELRQRFWVTRGRQTVKKVIANCVTCLKQNSRPFKSLPAPPLPHYRVNVQFPFSSTGVDYLGPLFVKNIFKNDTDELFKVYVVLYTCASSRAVYLDLVPDAFSRSFIKSLKRFISRHGIPKLFISDNARNFISQELKDYISYLNLEWEYILESSPWWGGFWERLVQMVKRCMRKVLKKSKLTYEELETIVVEIEGILNTRPLCYIYDDSTDPVITPSHLIYGRNILTRIPSNETHEKDYSKRAKYIQRLTEQFWKQWASNYLTELRERHKNCFKGPTRTIEIGEIVLIKEELVPRNKWKMGLVEQLHVGKDNHVRGCSLKVITNLHPRRINRPIEKLCPLEIRSEQFIPTANKDEPTNIQPIQNYISGNRPRREAAITGILRRIESE